MSSGYGRSRAWSGCSVLRSLDTRSSPRSDRPARVLGLWMWSRAPTSVFVLPSSSSSACGSPKSGRVNALKSGDSGSLSEQGGARPAGGAITPAGLCGTGRPPRPRGSHALGNEAEQHAPNGRGRMFVHPPCWQTCSTAMSVETLRRAGTRRRAPVHLEYSRVNGPGEHGTLGGAQPTRHFDPRRPMPRETRPPRPSLSGGGTSEGSSVLPVSDFVSWAEVGDPTMPPARSALRKGERVAPRRGHVRRLTGSR